MPTFILIDIWSFVFPSLSTINISKVFGIFGFLLFGYDQLKNKDSIRANYLYLLFLLYVTFSFIFFTFISTWPNFLENLHTVHFPIIRSLKQCVVISSELGLAYFMYRLVQKSEEVSALIKGMLLATFVAVIGIILEKFTKIDFYLLLNNGFPNIDFNRVRGFNYEPRAAAQVLSLGFCLSCLLLKNKWLKLGSALAFSVTIPLTISISGLVFTVIFCLLISIYSLLYKKYFNFICIIFFSAVYFLLSKNLHVNGRNFVSQFVERKFIITGKTPPKPESGAIENSVALSRLQLEMNKYKSHSFANHFEVFDGAAVNFFIHHPKYLVFGVGPGFSGLATSPYILDKDRHAWKKGSNNPPTTGFIYILTELGLVGLFLLGIIWSKTLFAIFKSNSKTVLFVFLTISISWILQARYFLPFIWFFTFVTKNEKLNTHLQD